MTKDEEDDDPRVTAADRAVIEAAKTGEGCIPITSVEQLQALADMARSTKDHFDARFATMTLNEAAFVRRLRCDEGYTWRAVADTCALEWSGDWGSNQLAGMAICEQAAVLLGEDPGAEPWN